jgi:hypothetical protein
VIFRSGARIGLSFVAVFVQLVMFAPTAPAQDVRQKWVGTWATPPVQTDAHRTFYRKTLRQIVHTSICGSSVRIRISNLFGDSFFSKDRLR